MSLLTFFQNSSDNNVLNKNLTHMGYGDDNLVPIQVVDECSFRNPIFRVGSMTFDFKKCNYLYSNQFDRYYYIDDIVTLNNGICELHCTEDVLMPFKSQIRDLYCLIERQESVENCNPYIVDDNIVGRVDRQIVKKSLQNSVGGNATGTHIVLTVTGGE